MRNCIDRIYYPGEMVYKRYRGTDTQQTHQKPNISKPEIIKSDKTDKNQEIGLKEDLAKGQIMKIRK